MARADESSQFVGKRSCVAGFAIARAVGVTGDLERVRAELAHALRHLGEHFLAAVVHLGLARVEEDLIGHVEHQILPTAADAHVPFLDFRLEFFRQLGLDSLELPFDLFLLCNRLPKLAGNLSEVLLEPSETRFGLLQPLRRPALPLLRLGEVGFETRASLSEREIEVVDERSREAEQKHEEHPAEPAPAALLPRPIIVIMPDRPA